MNKILPLCIFLFPVFFGVRAQSAYTLINRDYYHLIDRLEIQGRDFNSAFHTGVKPYRRDALAIYLDTVYFDNKGLNTVDRFNLEYLRNDSWEFSSAPTDDSNKPFWKTLYRKPSDFFHYRDSSFDIHINPVLYFQGGLESGDHSRSFRNTRGLEIRGSVDRKVGFYTYLSMTDLSFPSWVDAYTHQNGAVPGEGFWKRYNDTGYSYFSATGYFTFQFTKHISAQFGQDRNNIGEGYRSMILSDFSNPYMFFKLNTRIGRLDFTNLWAQMNADIIYNGGAPTDGRYPKKWFSFHRLGINITDRFNIGVFESVMSSELDWNYLNPLIFYRWVEHQLGTPDKVMLGTDFKWNWFENMQLYGQFALGEFVFREFFGIDGKNSSRNKHGLQIGHKYINVFGLSNLDLQLEYNHARPYTYQEKFPYQSYSNYRTPLAHPRGANFREILAIVRYQPLPRLNLNLTGMYQIYGADPDEESNFGGNVLKNRTVNSTSLFGNYIGQGVENNLLMANLTGSYMLKHNLFLDISQIYRNQKSEPPGPGASHFTQLSIRMNIARQDLNY